MAANDYYTSFSPSKHQSGNDSTRHDNRTDAPLPPLPGNQSQVSISPVSSPFDDRHYEYPSTTHLNSHAQQPAYASGGAYNDTAYHGASNPNTNQDRYDPPTHSTDPFADQNAIQLQDQAAKLDSSPTRYNADPEGRMYGVHEKKKKKQQRKKGWFSGRITWVVYILTAVQISVFVGELIRNGVLTGSPIEIKPQFNIMIGPSPYVLINMGARYPPCMHNILTVTDSKTPVSWPCPRTTSSNTSDPSMSCTLSDLCGFGGAGVPQQIYPTQFKDRSREPDQWWRFITPIFLHAGIIHISFNMLLQLTLGRDMEKEIGPLRFLLVYFSAGIFGFVLGGNYAAPNIPSVGASGSLFGILALVLLDLLYNWRSRRSPVKDLLFLLLDITIAFVLGLLPGLDNFSHIGGFLMGIVLGICLMHSPQALRQRIGVDEPPYSSVHTQPQNSGSKPTVSEFVKQPLGFFKGRKPFWWAWWLVRAGALVTVFVGFILLLRNFYEWRNECKWCHHLTCLPIKDWCNIGNFILQDTNNPTPQNGTQKQTRDLLGRNGPVVLAAFLGDFGLF